MSEGWVLDVKDKESLGSPQCIPSFAGREHRAGPPGRPVWQRPRAGPPEGGGGGGGAAWPPLQPGRRVAREGTELRRRHTPPSAPVHRQHQHLGLADYSEADTLGSRCNSDNFRAEKRGWHLKSYVSTHHTSISVQVPGATGLSINPQELRHLPPTPIVGPNKRIWEPISFERGIGSDPSAR